VVNNPRENLSNFQLISPEEVQTINTWNSLSEGIDPTDE
jgi:hypothetical protein